MPAELSVLEWSVRLIIAALLSGLVGFEREAKQKAAGLRTHMLVGLGAALFTLVGAYAFEDGDASRVSAQIVTGVGFLGAGAIFRQGATVSGLTTAAGLWAVAAIGMTAGAGLIEGAVVATGVAVIILYGLGLLERTLRDRRTSGMSRLVGISLANLEELPAIVTLANALDEEARQVAFEPEGDAGFAITMEVRADRLDAVRAGVSSFDSVVEASEIDPG